MYEAFYGLQERPFDLAPNPRFLVMNPGHREALSALRFGIEGRKGITLLTGPPGVGKTTLVQAALGAHQPDKDVMVVALTNPRLTRDEFFEFISLEFDLPEAARTSKTRVLRALKALLLERHQNGATTALVIDEAQSMSDELLEEVRLLSNIETASEKLLAIVLVGQSDLGDRLKVPGLQALRQRVGLRTTLPPLSPRQTAAYIAERLRIAGSDIDEVFEADAVDTICAYAGGIPRVISVICENALVCGFALDERPIGRHVIDEVRGDLDLDVDTPAAADVAPVAANAVPVAATSAPVATDGAPAAETSAPAAAATPASGLLVVPPAETAPNVLSAVDTEPPPPPPPGFFARLLQRISFR